MGAPSACSSRSIPVSTSSDSFVPPAAKSFTPLSANGLWEAVITAAATDSDCAIRATAGVGSTPSSSTSTPSAAKPATSAASSSGPERRVSRPMTMRGPPSTRAAARPRASAYSTVSSVFATPRTPSVPNRSVMPPPPRNARQGQRLVYCGALRAFLRPYFLLSFARASRVRRPAFFSAGRSSGSTSISARAMAMRSAPA